MSLRRSNRIAMQDNISPAKKKYTQHSIPVTLAKAQTKGKEKKARKMDSRSPQNENNPTTKPKAEALVKVKENVLNHIKDDSGTVESPPLTDNHNHFPPLTPNTSLKLREERSNIDDNSNLVSPVVKKGAWAKTLSYTYKKETNDRDNKRENNEESEESEEENVTVMEEDDTVCTIKSERNKNTKEEYKEKSTKEGNKFDNGKNDNEINADSDDETVETFKCSENNPKEKTQKTNKNKNDVINKGTNKEKNKKTNAKENESEEQKNQEAKKNTSKYGKDKGKDQGMKKFLLDQDDETVYTEGKLDEGIIKGAEDENQKNKDGKKPDTKNSETRKKTEKKDITKLGIFRYRLTINIPSVDQVKLQALVDGKSKEKILTNPDDRIKEVLTSWYQSIQEYDEGARLLSWAEKNTEIIPSPEKIPRDPATRNKYFQNVRASQKGDFRIFANVRVYSALSPEDLVENMQSWTAANSAYFSKTLIQAEYCIEIGWLAYTSQFSDPSVFKEKMEEITDFEWGFKLTAVTDSDKMDNKGNPTPWPKRIKALSATVPIENKKEAIKIMNFVFGTNKEDNKKERKRLKIPYADKYIFMEMERHTKSCNRHLNLLMRQTQSMVNRTTRAIFVSSIIGDIDEKIDTGVSKRSLRSMIDRILTKRSGDQLANLPLFQDVHQVNDGSKFYLNGSLGPKCPGHIFTFHKDAEEEAVEMAEGLNVYLEFLYGAEAFYNFFTSETWEGTMDWQWDEKEHLFIKPHDKKLEMIINNHPMAKLFDMELVLNDEKKKEKMVKDRECEHDRATKELLQRINGQNNNKESTGRNEDEASVVTEHTCNTSVTKNNKAEEKQKMNEKEKVKNSEKGKIEKMKTESKEYYEKIWDHSKSSEENKLVMNKIAEHKINKQVQDRTKQMYSESIEKATSAINEVATQKMTQCDNANIFIVDEYQSEGEDETIATGKYVTKIQEVGMITSTSITGKPKEEEVLDIIEKRGEYESEEETVETIQRTDRGFYEREKYEMRRDVRDKVEANTSEGDSDDNSTIMTKDSDRYQLMDDYNYEVESDKQIRGKDEHPDSKKETTLSDDDSEEVSFVKCIKGRKNKKSVWKEDESTLTHEQFLYAQKKFYRKKTVPPEDWDKTEYLCYRAVVLNSPKACKIINDNEALSISEQEEYENLSEEYFKRFPRKLKETKMVASNHNTGNRP